jgi:hypothetical protein
MNSRLIIVTSGQLSIPRGGTGANTAATARTALGLGGGLSSGGFYASSDGVFFDRFVTVTNGIITDVTIV